MPTHFDSASYRRGELYDAADWYDIDYQGYVAEEAFYRLMTTLHTNRGRGYVELGAGTGRLLLRYAEQGIQCHAVEPASAMLRHLMMSAQHRQLDMELLSTELAEAATFAAEPFEPGVVAFPFNGVLHIHGREALCQVYRHVHERLPANGRFCLDMTTPSWDELHLGGRAWGRPDERTHPQTGNRIFTTDRCHYDPKTRVMETEFRFLEDGAAEGVILSITQFMWTTQEVLSLAIESGFSVDLIFGDVDFSAFRESSPRMLVAFQKRSGG